jgi:hypothetical protein
MTRRFKLTEHQFEILLAVAQSREFKTLISEVDLMVDRGLLTVADQRKMGEHETQYVMQLTPAGLSCLKGWPDHVKRP